MIRKGIIFGAETCLKEFRSTRLICFAKAVLVQSITSNMHSFEQFKVHQNCNLTYDHKFRREICTKTAISERKGVIRRQVAVLVHLKLFETPIKKRFWTHD